MYTYTAFDQFENIAQGSLENIALDIRKYLKENKQAQVLIFCDLTGKQIDLDLSGTDKESLERLKIYTSVTPQTQTGAGRPRLGVIAREVSLLPTHWEWLMNQDGGASTTLRKLIDEKIKSNSKNADLVKSAQEATYKFLSAVAGNLPNFDEVNRYLYRKDKKKFEEYMHGWHKDVIQYAKTLSEIVFK